MEIVKKKITIGLKTIILAGALVLLLSGISIFVKGRIFSGNGINSADSPKNNNAENANENLDADSDGLLDRIEKAGEVFTLAYYPTSEGAYLMATPRRNRDHLEIGGRYPIHCIGRLEPIEMPRLLYSISAASNNFFPKGTGYLGKYLS